MNEKVYLALLHKIGLNQKKLNIIFREHSNYKYFYENLSSKLLCVFGFSPKQIIFILKNKKEYSIANIVAKLKERDVKIITIKDILYPNFLREISNTPYLLYVRGSISDSPKIAVVGTRKMTSYGERSIEKIVGSISSYFTIISGGAAGCDTLAHKICLNNNKKTISVIGTGIDLDYPIGNKGLYKNIVDGGGAIISIFPIGEVGNSYNFPIRNEIVAGLSSGVLVVEAQKKSGTLITSNLALDLGKDLFAIPGDIFRGTSEGCNMLIKKGMAKLTTEASDILEEYNISNNNVREKNEIVFTDKIEENLYNILLLESLTINELVGKLKIDISTLSFKLSMMEINNHIKKSLGGKYEIF